LPPTEANEEAGSAGLSDQIYRARGEPRGSEIYRARQSPPLREIINNSRLRDATRFKSRDSRGAVAEIQEGRSGGRAEPGRKPVAEAKDVRGRARASRAGGVGVVGRVRGTTAGRSRSRCLLPRRGGGDREGGAVLATKTRGGRGVFFFPWPLRCVLSSST
jgi:hypothetical protein